MAARFEPDPSAPDAAGTLDASPARRALEARLVRYDDLVPCLNAFVDSRTPGSDAKENFTIVGPGVSENPNQHVHVPEPHGFNIGAARQPPGCLNSQHSHLTAEVFVVHTGRWAFRYGVNADEGEVRLSPGDAISIPPMMFRGFENVGDGTGFLFAVLGGDDPGKVTWAPRVFELARDYGLVLLKGGRLVDTTAGETVPDGAEPESVPDAETLLALATADADRLAGCVAHGDDLVAHGGVGGGGSWASVGVEAAPVIVDADAGSGGIRHWWPHGFDLHRLRLDPEAATARRETGAPEVVFVQSGALVVELGDESIGMGAGDTFSVPVGSSCALRNPDAATAEVFVVSGRPG